MYDLYAACDAWMRTMSAQVDIAKAYVEGLHAYNGDFLRPLLKSMATFNRVEANRLWQRTPMENLESYEKLLNFNVELMSRYGIGTLQVLDQYNQQELPKMVAAWFETALDSKVKSSMNSSSARKKCWIRYSMSFPAPSRRSNRNTVSTSRGSRKASLPRPTDSRCIK